MKISNVQIEHSPDKIIADLLFSIGGGVVRPGVQIDKFCDAWLDCLNQLDRDGVYTFLDPKSQSYLRLVRNGEEVVVQSDSHTHLPEDPRRLKYAKLRAGILVMLDMYRDQLAERAPSHPEARRIQARLATIEAG